MYSDIVPLNHSIYIIPIIFKSKENLDNNFNKTIKITPFIGYSEMSWPLFDFVGFLVGQVDPSLDKPIIFGFLNRLLFRYDIALPI